jgi:hypothetical protein
MPDEVPVEQQGGGGGTDAKQAVKAPAIFLMVVGFLGILAGLINVGRAILMGGQIQAQMEQMGPDAPAWMGMMFGTIGVVIGLLMIILSLIVVLGSMKMMNLKNRGMAIAASIIAMIPFANGPCCVLGIAAGIWCLVVLTKPEIKNAFQ